MAHYVAPAASLKQALAQWVSPEGGNWRRVLGRWVEVDGEWVQYFSAGAATLAPATVRGFAYDPDIPVAKLEFTPGGKTVATYSDQSVVTTKDLPDWYDPRAEGAGTAFEVFAKRISGISGGLINGDALDTWLPLSESRSWSIEGILGTFLNRPLSITLEVAVRPLGGEEPASVAQYTLSTTTYNVGNPNGLYSKGGGVDVLSPYRFLRPET